MSESQYCWLSPLLPLLFTIHLTTATLFLNLPASQLTRFRFIFNATALAINRTPKFSYISPVLKSLGWLKINEHIQFKILFNPYTSINLINWSTVCNLLIIQPVYLPLLLFFVLHILVIFMTVLFLTLLLSCETIYPGISSDSQFLFSDYFSSCLGSLLLNSILNENERLIYLPIHILHSLLHPVDEILWFLSLLWLFI